MELSISGYTTVPGTVYAKSVDIMGDLSTTGYYLMVMSFD